tara:strand:- start:369 stop:1529 length:1161 start_codon:yes stop_codon:yes gene_type:complete
MKIKIAILGSTGSIGNTTLNIIKKNRSKFDVELLTANNNYKKIIKQAKIFRPKNILISNKKHYLKVKKQLNNRSTKVFFGEKPINHIIKKKIDFTIAAIVGVKGLKPTVEAIKCSKKVAIANKESIVCGWNLILKNIKKFNTKILPIDSEHFSILELSKDLKDKDIEEIILTASGGPFFNTPLKKLKNIKPEQAIKHPNWRMGKKISIDSSTLMNKVFETIEASKLFKFDVKKYKIMIHPQSYVHAIVRYKNGLIKMLLHNTDMTIPISNTILGNSSCGNKIEDLDILRLDNLRFFKVDKKRYPSIKLIDKCFKSGKSAPVILNASNEILVSLFLQKKIKFTDITNILNKIFRHKDFKKYAKKKTSSLMDIYKLDRWARELTYKFI